MRLAKLIKKRQLDFLYETLDCELIQNGITSVVLIDLAGNVLTNLSNGEHDFDTYSLASLTAGNFGAVTALLDQIGEPELTLLFNQGQMLNIYFRKISADYILIVVFDKSISLGYVRLKMDTIENLVKETLT
ncbi:MAG: roadblock/LC7 domain-containing protein [Desulfobacteraceae bacterium]|jgi:predicted regulator of Ras-like GTPase activity (Roadblock/LC7/MglB family)|nr:roadblock/LC7 domain-containing protein [Desulfobacteraceae bacterium]MDH3838169.1 roadblock/LC7 domain-containing protein [Desulfobacteraceae bacterium]